MKWASACLAIYLLAGGLGLPVFAAGKGGFAHFAGPTGGYLIGFFLAAFLVGIITDIADKRTELTGSKRFVVDLVAVLIGSSAIYAVGVPWLQQVTGMPMQKAFTVGALPFLLGDGIKMVAAVIIARSVRPAFGKTVAATKQSAV
jgi:biotin transport system substrate-specific component